ncbi:MAG: hypothetical protein AB8I08_18235 [Sandaracinaceae bacterium]
MENLFYLDGTERPLDQPTTLHYNTTSPLAVQDTCGSSGGCTLDSSEQGMAFDSDSNRLFIAVTRGRDVPGDVAVWDVSSPMMLIELAPRLRAGKAPAWVFVY